MSMSDPATIKIKPESDEVNDEDEYEEVDWEARIKNARKS